jgi:hypothetical protein
MAMVAGHEHDIVVPPQGGGIAWLTMLNQWEPRPTAIWTRVVRSTDPEHRRNNGEMLRRPEMECKGTGPCQGAAPPLVHLHSQEFRKIEADTVSFFMVIVGREAGPSC